MGAGAWGTALAKVLADAYDEVHIVDRDKIVGLKGPRKHCPQTYQANGLLTRGVQIIAPLGRDDLLITVAAALETVDPWTHRRATVSA